MPGLLLEANHIQKTYGTRTVLDIDSLRIYDGERVALIGENGAGKSTLLSVLCGDTPPDRGTVTRFCAVSCIRQSGQAQEDGSGHLLSVMKAPRLRDGLSGGELTRGRIARALADDTPLLFADEPTTDLDMNGAETLLRLLKNRRGALVLVSHDRTLLNALCTRVLHLEDGKITDFPGTYDDYRRELERKRAFQQAEYDRYRAEKARLKALAQQKAEWAASVKKAPSRMGNSEARLHTREYTNAVLHQSAARRTVLDRMDRLEKKEKPRDLPEIRMTLGLDTPIRARTALSARCERLTAGGKTLLENAELTLPTGSRTALTGENGCGKTTLMRALRGEAAPGTAFTGEIRLNPGARTAWFDQDHAKMLRDDWTVLENVTSDSQRQDAQARTVLARLGLAGDAVFKPAGVLSGGEKAKVSLAKLLLSSANLLLMDEPTNHLDVFTMEALEALLRDYGGTLLFVSHDRAFVSAVATRELVMAGGSLKTVETAPARTPPDEAPDAARLDVTALEMRLAALAARLSAPRKGDRPDLLREEYEALAQQLIRLRQDAAHG